MNNYAVWYDGGTGWFEFYAEITAESAEMALKQVNDMGWCNCIVSTASFDDNPNNCWDNVLALDKPYARPR